MDYQQAVDYIESPALPRGRYGLERLKQALELLGNPQHKVRFVHVAGTNGKGSCAAMLASVLKEAGYRTGLYISPHLRRYNERMQVDGVDISDDDLIRAAQRVKEVCEQLGGTPIVFEVLTLMALWYFAERRCDFVVLEVGIGGKLDATNCIPAPAAALIAQLGFDHTETLGSTIEEIAAQKGGIAKSGSQLVMAEQEPAGPAGGRAALPGAGLRLHRGGPGAAAGALHLTGRAAAAGQNLRGASAAAGRIPSGEKTPPTC